MTVLVACLVFMPAVCLALLEGQTIDVYHFHGTAPDTTLVIGPAQSLVGPGTEFVDFGWSGFVDIDVSDTTILITLKVNQPFGYSDVLRFTDPNGTIPELTGVTVNSATNWAGFDASRVQIVGGNVLDVHVTGLAGVQGQQISLELAGAQSPAPETLTVAVDVEPGRCANTLRGKGKLRVAIPGSASLDVTQIDLATVRLEGVAPRRSGIDDKAAMDCDATSDGVPDLLLTFRADEVFAALGAVTDGETRVLTLTGELGEEFGGIPIRGEDGVIVRSRKSH